MKVLEKIRSVLGELGPQGITDWAILLTYLIGTIVLLTLLIYIQHKRGHARAVVNYISDRVVHTARYQGIAFCCARNIAGATYNLRVRLRAPNAINQHAACSVAPGRNPTSTVE